MKRKHPGKKYKQGSDTDNGAYMALGGGNWANKHTHIHTQTHANFQN